MAITKQVQALATLGISASYQELPFGIIDANPDQPRQDFNDADILELSVSIEENTLLQAVTILGHPTIPGRYMIVAGERRFRAMQVAGKSKTVFKVLEGPGVAKRSYVLSAIENIHRVQLNPIEEAHCYQRLHDEEHLSWEEIHGLLGRDVSYMLNKIKLLNFPPAIIEKIRRGDLPQATALNLSQWQNEEGDYMRMAHDIIAGRNPAEIHFRKETIRGQRQVQARLPKTPDEFAVRIVKLSGHVQSMPAVLEAFLSLSSIGQTQVFDAIHPSVLGKLRVRFVALHRAIQAVSERMNTYDAIRMGREKPEEGSLKPGPATPALTPPAPATVVNIKRQVPRELAEARVPIPAVETVKAVPRRQPASPESPHNEQSLEISRLVLVALFYSGGQRRVNLSRAHLANAVSKDTSEDPEVLLRNALRHAREHWRMAPQGAEAKQKLIRLMHRIRHGFGEATKLEDALRMAKSEDESEDPVSLGF